MDKVLTTDSPEQNPRKSPVFLFYIDRWIVLIGAFLFCSVLASWMGLAQIKTHVQYELRENLLTILQITEKALHVWIDDRVDDAEHIADRPDTQLYIKDLLALPQNKEALATSAAQHKLSAYFKQFTTHHKDMNIWLIAPNGTIIASADETHLTQEVQFDTTGNALRSVFKGSFQISLPFRRQIMTEDSNSNTSLDKPSIYIMVPCFDTTGAVLAALAFRIDPSLDFSQIIQLAQTGETGDSYAFSDEGWLISESRFVDQFQRSGRLGSDQSAILNLSPRDPGGDIEAGFQPRGSQSSWPFTQMATRAYTEGKGYNVSGYRDYRGISVVGAWNWIDQYGFGLAFEVDTSEAFSTFTTIRNTLIRIILLTLLLSLILFCILIQKKRAIEVSAQHLEKEVVERQKSEDKFRMLIDASPDGMVIINTEGTISLVNRRAEEMFGYSRVELQGRKIELLIPKRFARRHPSHRDSFFKNMHVRPMGADLNLWGLRKDGSEFPVEISLSPVQTKGEVATIASIRDVSIRREIEEKIIKNEAGLAEAQRIAHLGNWELDIGKNSLYWSDEVYRIFELSPQEFEVSYEAFLDNVHPDDREMVNNAYTDSLTDKTPYETVHRIKLKDGTVKYVHERCQTSFDENGKAFRSIGTVQDITKEKKIEEELIEHREHLEELVRERTNELKKEKETVEEAKQELEFVQYAVDHSADMMFWMSIKDDSFFYVNRTGAQRLGYTQDEMTGMRLSQIAPEFSEGQWLLLVERLKKGESLVFESTHQTKSGKDYPVEITSQYVEFGEQKRIIASARDVTERKEVEKELHIHLDEMERFSRLAVGREQRMIHLKKEINELCDQLGRKKKYRIVQ